MGFRDRLLLGLVCLVLGVAGLQMGLGYWSFSRSLDQDFRTDLQKYALLVAEALDLHQPIPTLNPQKVPSFSGYAGRFRLLQQDRLIFEGGGPFPEQDPDWWTYRQPLSNGYVLEVALSQSEHNRALGEYLRTGGLTLLFSVGLALLVAWGLRLYLLRPILRLEQATHSLAQARFPEPLPVQGRDEMARLTQSFNQMVIKVRRALERERSFTRYVSHELRNPLAAIKTTAEAVRLGALPPEALHPVLERNLERVEHTLNGLLALARGLDSYTEVELPEVLEALLRRLPEEARQRVLFKSEPARLRLPQEAFEAAVQNLLDNALKYSRGRVWLEFSQNPHPTLRVRDEGPGVPEEALARLGEPFYRPHRQPGGLGLGLAFVRQAVEHMGGRLELRNHPQGGLEATLVLPGGLGV